MRAWTRESLVNIVQFTWQRWPIWTNWECSGSKSKWCSANTKRSNCQRKVSRTRAWPRITQIARFIDSRNLALKITKTFIRQAQPCIYRTFRKCVRCHKKISPYPSYSMNFSFHLPNNCREKEISILAPNFSLGGSTAAFNYPCRATVAEEEIKDAFTKNGFTVKAFKFFPKDRKMALIQMPNMDDAVAALIVSSFRN